MHAKRLAATRHHASDATVAVHPQRLAAQGAAYPGLPSSTLERRHLLRNVSHRRKHKPPGEFGCRVRGSAGMEVGRNHDPKPGAGPDIDVGIDTALADQAELRQAFQKRSLNLGSFPEKHEHFAVMEPLRQNIDRRGVILPDRDLMAVQLLETLQGSERVMVVVQDGYFHAFFS